MSQLAPCDLADGETCAREFIAEFGTKAYRRPLEQAEIDAYVTLFNLGVTNGGASNGFRLVVEAMLQAPSFLYHADLGDQAAPTATPGRAERLRARVAPFVLLVEHDARRCALRARRERRACR